MPLMLTTSTDPSGVALLNMTIVQGESIQASVTIANNGAPMDLTGYGVKFQIDLPTPVTLSTMNGGIVLADPANGVAQIVVTDAQSEAFAPGSYASEFWIVNGTFALRIWPGTFTVLKSITSVP